MIKNLNLKWLINLSTIALICFITLSCSGEDEEKSNNGSYNTTDVAVTSNVVKLGITYAQIEGYVNLNLITSSYTEQEIGIELSTTEDFNKVDKTISKELEGNKLSVVIDTLSGNTKYFYRTFVKVNDLSYYGEKRSFTTENFNNITSTGDVTNITFTTAKINCKANADENCYDNKIKVGIAYSTIKNRLHPDSLSYVTNWNGTAIRTEPHKISYPIDSIKNNSYIIPVSGLSNGKTYYYCSFTRAGNKYKFGEIKEFKTASLSENYLQTGDATEVTLTSACIKNISKIESIYPEDTHFEYGIRWSDNKEDLENNKKYSTIRSTIKENIFETKIKGLLPYSTYYYYAFAEVNYSLLSGEIKCFKTKSANSYIKTEDATNITNTSAQLNGTTTLSTLYSEEDNRVNYYIRYSTDSVNLKSSNSYYNYFDTKNPTKNGNNLSTTVSDLDNGTTYFFCIVAKIDGVYFFGDIKQFTTEQSNPTGDGTLANPYNSDAANNFASTLADGVESDDVYIKGKISSIKEEFGTQYGNATFYISDDGTENGQFYVYRTLYLGNKAYAGGENIKVGDKVIIHGKITNYMGNTPETVQKASYVYSLNGKTADGNSITLIPSEMGYENAAEITTITLSDGTTLTFDAGGNQNGPKYYNTGKGIRIYPKNSMKVSSSKKIASIVMTVDVYNGETYNASGDLQANPGTTAVSENTVTFGGINNQECTITNTSTTTGAKSQVRMTQLKIVYAE